MFFRVPNSVRKTRNLALLQHTLFIFFSKFTKKKFVKMICLIFDWQVVIDKCRKWQYFRHDRFVIVIQCAPTSFRWEFLLQFFGKKKFVNLKWGLYCLARMSTNFDEFFDFPEIYWINVQNLLVHLCSICFTEFNFFRHGRPDSAVGSGPN